MCDLRPIFLLGLLAAPAGADPARDVAHALRQFAKRPGMRIADAYKYLHQQSRGAEHAVTSAESARNWMREEWAALGPTPAGEELLEPLTPDGRLVRVNLRPYRDGGGEPDGLVDLFVATARHPRGTGDDFEARWRILGRRLDEGPIGELTRESWKEFDIRMKAEGHPATHHSPEYRARYRPAYRVIDLHRGGAKALLSGLSTSSSP